MNITFRDRPLKKEEMHHHYCGVCGSEIYYDLVYNHKCRTDVINKENKLDLLLLKSRWRVRLDY